MSNVKSFIKVLNENLPLERCIFVVIDKKHPNVIEAVKKEFGARIIGENAPPMLPTCTSLQLVHNVHENHKNCIVVAYEEK